MPSDTATDGTERPPGQVCPNPDCHIDQRWEGFRGLACPECGTKLAVACEKCDSGAVERVDGSPRCSEHVPDLVADGGTERIAFIDIYSGPGGVGYALDAIIREYDLPVDHIGIDKTDYSDTYPGDFAQCDASSVGQVINAVWYYLVDYDVVILWMSPPCLAYSTVSWSNCNQLGFDDPREYYPTFADLNVRVVLEAIDPDAYIIENVANCEDIREPTRINGFGVGLPFDLERHFETSFPCPNRLDDGEAEAGHFTRTGDWQSKKPLARTKGVPEDWGRQEIRSAMPREVVQYLLHYCPEFPEVPLPDGVEDRQQFLTESFVAATDGGETRSHSTTDTEQSEGSQ